MAQARTNGKAETSDVTAQIDTIKQDIAVLTSMMTDLAQDKKENLKAGTLSKLDAAQEKAVQTGEHLRGEAEIAFHKAEETVRQQPAMAVGIAAGLGFLVGMMTSRRA
ncbi:DUF883 family protein [Roseobacter sp. EG26]|uniref:DUF883 family protein n=1 Tax=Roseobacter sp. EG26 TaxID=3412477 RepID=UPI003CE51BCA